MHVATHHRGARAAGPAFGEDRNREQEGPLENPAIEPIPDDPLLEPHPSEPGVRGDGGASPPENPGGARSGR